MKKEFKKYCVIKNIHNAEDYYHNLRDMYANCDSIKYNERVSEYFDSEDIALETMKKLAKEYVADDKEIVVEFTTIEVRFRFEDVDIEDEDFDIEDEDYRDYTWDYADAVIDNSIYVEYDYKSLDGALLIVWSWEKYIGYARNFIELRLGTDREDETLLLKQDKVFAQQVDILLTADEMEKMSSDDIENYLWNELLDNGWKWTNERAVEKAISIGNDD